MCSDGPDFQKSNFGWPWVIGWTQVEQGFASIFAAHFRWFFKVPQRLRRTPLWKIVKKFGKKWRNALLNLRLTHFSHWFLLAKTRFQRPGPSLNSKLLVKKNIKISRKKNSISGSKINSRKKRNYHPWYSCSDSRNRFLSNIQIWWRNFQTSLVTNSRIKYQFSICIFHSWTKNSSQL